MGLVHGGVRMELGERSAAVLGAFFANTKNRIGLIIMAALFIPFALMGLFDELRYAIGYKYTSIFARPDDRFADLLKAAMSYRSITADLIGSHQIASWSQVYRNYLTAQPRFEGIILSHYNMPPLGALFHVFVAELLVAFDPSTALWTSILLYVTGAFFASLLLRRFFHVSVMDQIAVLFAFLLSFPALFMITRGNFLAGYTCVCLAVYVLTAMKGQYRWLGLVCLALAINIRPNTFVFGLLELVILNDHCERKILGAGFLAMAIAYLSFLIVQTVDPDFVLDNLIEGMAVYNKAYVEGYMGFTWNFSLYGTTRVLRDSIGLQPYNETCNSIVNILGILSALATLYLILMRRLTVVTATFLATALSALFTPVFAFYHMVEFIVPLMAVLAAKGPATKIGSENMLIFAVSLFCLCPFDEKRTIYPLFIFATMILLMVRAYRKESDVVESEPVS